MLQSHPTSLTLQISPPPLSFAAYFAKSMRPSPNNCFQILLLRHRQADALNAQLLLSSLYFRFVLAAHPSLTIFHRSFSDFLSRRIRLIDLMPSLPAIQLTLRSASFLLKRNLISLSSSSRSTSASSFATRSWLVPLLPSPHNECTTCAAARHKPNFISQPKPRHSLPRQVRAVLRDGEPARQTPPRTMTSSRTSILIFVIFWHWEFNVLSCHNIS